MNEQHHVITASNSSEKDMLLQVSNLSVHFELKSGVIRANNQVSITLARGKTLGIVGESGSGKSVLCRSIIQLLPMPPARITGGEARFENINLLSLNDSQMQSIRGAKISMIFQDPMTSLNPVLRVGDQIIEGLLYHGKITKQDGKEFAIELLKKVGIPSPEKRVNDYPHQLSGGMRQRVMIAMAISAQPRLLLADEPTTALDVTIQDQILNLIMELQENIGMSIILVSHDMGVVAETSDDVAVMYGGKVMEQASTKEVFLNPLHPYTRGLLDSIPSLKGGARRLIPIKGQPPNLLQLPPGCPFFERCKVAENGVCDMTPVRLREIKPAHFSACHFPERI